MDVGLFRKTNTLPKAIAVHPNKLLTFHTFPITKYPKKVIIRAWKLPVL